MLAALISALLMQAPLPAPGGPAEQERFKTFFTKGETLYGEGEYGAAIWNFRKADTIRRTPEVVYDLAKCHEKLGDVAFTTFYFREYLKRAPTASDALNVAGRVGSVLAQAESDGKGLLEINASGGEDVTITNRTYAEGPVALFLPPGEYEITARFPAGTKRMMTQVRTGKTTTVTFEPLPPPLFDAAQSLAPEAVSGSVSTMPRSAKLRYGSYLAAGVGAVLLGVGIGLGVASQGEGRRAQDITLPYADAVALADAANGKARAANGLLIGGSIVLAGAAALFVLSFVLPNPGEPTAEHP